MLDTTGVICEQVTTWVLYYWKIVYLDHIFFSFVFYSLQKLLHSSRKLSLQVLNFVHSFQVRSNNNPDTNRSVWSVIPFCPLTCLSWVYGNISGLFYLSFLQVVLVLSTQVLFEGQSKYFSIPSIASLSTCLNSVVETSTKLQVLWK